MKNSFSSSIDIQHEPDGAIAYSYKAQGQRTLRMLGVLAVPLYFVSCSATRLAAEGLGMPDEGAVSTGIIGGFVLLVLLMVLLVYRRETLRIYPNKGIAFRRKTVPFSDMQRILSIQHQDRHVVYLETMGRRVKVTNEVKAAIASVLYEEVLKHFNEWQENLADAQHVAAR